MRETATVVMVDGKLVAEVLRPEACKKCGACEFSSNERFHLQVPSGDEEFREGDTVTISMSEGKVGIASLIAYGVPLMMFLLGIWVGDAVFHTEMGQIVTAVAALGLGFFAVKCIDRRIKNQKAFTLAIRPRVCVEDEEE